MSFVSKIVCCNVKQVHLSRNCNVRWLQLRKDVGYNHCRCIHTAHVASKQIALTCRLTDFRMMDLTCQAVFYRKVYTTSCNFDNNIGTTIKEVGFEPEDDKIVQWRNGDIDEKKTLERMRVKMRQRHGIETAHVRIDQTDKTISKPDSLSSDDILSPKNSLKMKQSIITSGISQNIHTNESSAKNDAEFIVNVRSGNFNALAADNDNEAFIEMPFGLVRLDNMNQPKLKAKHNRNQVNPQNHVWDASHNILKHTIDSTGQQDTTGKHNQMETENHVDRSVVNLTKHSGAVTKTKSNVFDEEYFGSYAAEPTVYKSEDVILNTKESSNFIENQYFGNENESSNSKVGITSKSVTSSSPHTEANNFKDNVFEEQYFTRDGHLISDMTELVDVDIKNRNEKPMLNSFGLMENLNQQNDAVTFTSDSAIKPTPLARSAVEKKAIKLNKDQRLEKTDSQHNKIKTTLETRSSWTNKSADDRDEFNSLNNFQDLSILKKDAENTVFHETVTKREIKSRTRLAANIENPQTAFDLAMKIRLESRGKLQPPTTESEDKKSATEELVSLPREQKWTGKVDSQGFKILTSQVLDVQRFTEHDIVSILKDSIIYDDDHLLVIDKPYGLPSHGGPGVHHSVGKLLEPLASRLDLTGSLGGTLNLVHRLDKETTGVMILAKGQPVAEMLLAMFKKRQVVKHYWVITKGIPNPLEGVVDIPMGEGTVAGRYRMELRPNFPREAKLLANLHRSSNRIEAITNYRVLSSNSCAALVECHPETGVKHQIRCHLAFGLNTPVLGDHKYSHYSKMAPQKLYPEILQRLGIRQAKVRHLPMHLHAKAVILPEFKDGHNLFLSARLPKHFVQNMKWLKLKPPQ